MASIVSAGTTSATALNMSADTSGVLQLASNNGIVAVTVDTAQKTTINNLSATAYTPATSLLTSGTAQNTTSGTSIDFTGIPSWVKRITVMFSGVSTTGSSDWLVQIGAGSFLTSGYNSACIRISAGITSTSGFIVTGGAQNSAWFYGGLVTLATMGSNKWVECGSVATASNANYSSGGEVTLSGTLDRLRITTVNGTDTFDAGSINILYE